MGFLRRLLGGHPGETGPGAEAPTTPDAGEAAPDAHGEVAIEATDEAARDRELLRADAERLDDALLQRQLRYADRSWTPPAQGGPRRADDTQDATER